MTSSDDASFRIVNILTEVEQICARSAIISYGKPARDEEPDRDDDLVNLLATKNLIVVNINLIVIKIRGT